MRTPIDKVRVQGILREDLVDQRLELRRHQRLGISSISGTPSRKSAAERTHAPRFRVLSRPFLCPICRGDPLLGQLLQCTYVELLLFLGVAWLWVLQSKLAWPHLGKHRSQAKQERREPSRERPAKPHLRKHMKTHLPPLAKPTSSKANTRTTSLVVHLISGGIHIATLSLRMNIQANSLASFAGLRRLISSPSARTLG